MDQKKICAWCYYARMRRDICGIYCTGGFENPDGSCDHFLDSKKKPEKKLSEFHGPQGAGEAGE